MGQSFKAILQLVLIIAVIGAIIAWSADARDPLVIGFRCASPALAVVIIVVLWRNSRRRETLPDRLAQVCRNYFERDGFCFAMVPVVREGICWMQVFFQNRYSNTCTARVVLQPPVKSFGFRRQPVAGIDVDIVCDGGAFGVYRIAWPINSKLQGKRIRFEVACDSRYPDGRGTLLRYREGLRAGTPGGGARRAAATAGLLLVGVVSLSRPATVQMVLPTGVADQISPEVPPTCEILFRPDLPTGGFPVLPTAALQPPPAPPEIS